MEVQIVVSLWFTHPKVNIEVVACMLLMDQSSLGAMMQINSNQNLHGPIIMRSEKNGLKGRLRIIILTPILVAIIGVLVLSSATKES